MGGQAGLAEGSGGQVGPIGVIGGMRGKQHPWRNEREQAGSAVVGSRQNLEE